MRDSGDCDMWRPGCVAIPSEYFLAVNRFSHIIHGHIEQTNTWTKRLEFHLLH